MLEKPDLPDEILLGVLRDRYAVSATGLEFLPLGNDSGAWAYRAKAGEETYFLKLRRLPVQEVNLALPRWLREQGLEEVVAPFADREGRLWAPAGEYGVIVSPYIHGRPGMETGLTPAQWTAFGAALKRIHAVRPPDWLARKVPVETFHPPWAAMVRHLQARIEAGGFLNLHQARLADFWQARRDEIARITARTEELGRRLRESAGDFLLCHADIHTANILVDPHGGLHIVDWDQPIYAPKERDLMFIEAPDTPEGERFYQGYGETRLNPLAQAYYRYEWVVQEIGDYGERVFFREDLGEETLADSVAGFEALFGPADVVEGAYETEAGLAEH